ncbi:Two-component response regulator-like APRR9 [Hibiscus syriacus]|uniref:Two-component response regulator-like APRR9 n=1 Tax=Hibiscus syriacus TaxID=106335 RepID=A0A6A2WMJ1_HIBSY|nr:Two-component response regulator-like APRR9 [Hibiscus syriacus]
MGEVGMEVDVTAGTAEEWKKDERNESLEVVPWERFLPCSVLRVLLVEADDSTRQIIGALLQKCSYKVVVGVSDGLMAWETIKDRPHSIDLILTEVELPSITGFTLLALITEHDICKNIPVIMMSSNDSVNTVLKCMMKGAADFLIKPVRRNELRNLWHHVWRRQMLPGEHVPHNLPATEHKFEATAENDAESNQWSNYGSSIQKYNEANDTQCFSQPKRMNGNLSDFGREQRGNVVKLGQKSLQNEGQSEENSNRLAKEVAHCSEACEPNASKLEEKPSFVKGMIQNDAAELQSNSGNVNVMVRVGCNDELDEPPTGSVDLIGSFNNQPRGTLALSHLIYCDGVEFSPQLELCLRRSCFSKGKNEVTTERHMLNHSDASAFSWYKNSKSLQSIFPTLANNQAAMKESDRKLGQHLECNNGTFQPRAVTHRYSWENLPITQLGLIPVPGVMMYDMDVACRNIIPQVDYG